MNITLVTRTPYRLRYLCVTVPNETGIEAGIIPNAAGATPDLRTDSSLWLNFPMNSLVKTPAPTDAAAQKLLMGILQTTVPALEIPRAHVYITPRNTADNANPLWSVLAFEGSSVMAVTSAGFAVLYVVGPANLLAAPQEAYVDIDFEHTYDR